MATVGLQSGGGAVEWRPGESLLAVARRLGAALEAPCGGRGSCGQCRVRIARVMNPATDSAATIGLDVNANANATPLPAEEKNNPATANGAGDIHGRGTGDGVESPAAPPAPSAACRRVFDADELAAGWRLACQMREPVSLILDAPIAADAASPAGRSKTSAMFEASGISGLSAARAARIDTPPLVEIVDVPPPAADDPRGDWERVVDASPAARAQRGRPESEGIKRPPPGPRATLSALRELPARLRENDGRVRLVWRDGELLRALSPREDFRAVGLAVDLGTTTVAGVLTDLSTGDDLAVAARANPQNIFGDDLVARVERALADDKDRRELSRLASAAIDDILREACRLAGLPTGSVSGLAVAGNTAMQQLWLGMDARGLASSPLTPALCGGLGLRAGEAGLASCDGDTPLWVAPVIGAFVGGDAALGLLARAADEFAGVGLFMDVGTNGEMALAADGRLWACSAAAGPAFEGARIGQGMRATEGAIASVEFDADADAGAGAAGGRGDIRIGVVGGGAPVGICGSGLMDAVAVLLDLGVVDPGGRMLDPEEYAAAFAQAPEAIRRRLRRGPCAGAGVGGGVVVGGGGDEPYFVLWEADGETGAGGRGVCLRRRDVREFQLAKGAMAAGAELLLERSGRSWRDLDRVWLAGGFGGGLNPRSARRTGLLHPSIPLERIWPVGNAALSGARMVLLSSAEREAAQRLAAAANHLELSSHPSFARAFAEGMLFPAGRGASRIE